MTTERCKVQQREYNAKYRKNHPEKCKASDAKYYQANREKVLARNNGWFIANPDRHKAYESIRRHKDRGFIVNLTTDQLEAIMVAIPNCQQCGIEFSNPRFKTVDRINDATVMDARTIQIICWRCNIRNYWEQKRRRNT